MKVTVKVIGPLAYAAGFSEKDLTFPGPATAGELLSRVNVANRPIIVTRNGRAVSPHDALDEGDRIVISPIYSGG
ncbi:MAG: MoaD/ThiS family protein [Gemmatimonadales bacterium]|jgi:sulfur carrier protein ThiS